MNTKKTVLIIALTALTFIFVVSNPLMFGFCQHIDTWTYATRYCFDNDILPGVVSFLVFSLSLIFLLLSLITYRMKDEVFRAWWNFARWWVPVIIAVTLFVQNAGGGGGIGIGGAVSGAFDALVIGIFYFIFILVSLVRIVRAYQKTKVK